MVVIKKSKAEVNTAEIEMMSLGKYIFFIMLALLTIELADALTPCEKKFQNKSPEK